jgi:hypothetical protein
MTAIADEEFARTEEQGLTGERIYWTRDQVLIRRDLETFLVHDNERRGGRLAPAHTELAFGVRGAEPVRIDVRGVTILLRGSIDLVDIAEDGTIWVTDYKTGSAFKVDPDDPDDRGRHLQLVLYAQAARAVLGMADAAVHSQYWFVSRKGGFASRGYDVTPAIADHASATVALIVDHIARGIFPQHPEPTTRTQWVSCAYCDPDGLGVTDARRRFDAMADDPLMAGYVDLAEPGLRPARLLDEATS